MDHPFCFECGYDLSGLELPRPCPECGQVADPVAQAAEAREWFARRSAKMKWLVRPRTIPPGLWYVLSDPASVKLARRRVVCWLWLPAILAVITVGVGSFVTVEYDVRVWYYEGSDPERGPVRDVSGTQTDRLFALNLHFFSVEWWFTKPASWVRVNERQPKRFGVSLPESMEPMFLFLGCGPLLAAAFGYFPSSRLVVSWATYRATKQSRVNPAKATRTAWSLIAVPLGMAAWVWVLGVLVYGVHELCGLNDNILYLVSALLWAAPGWWVLVSLVGYGVLVRQDRPGFDVGNRLGLWAIAVVLSVGGPAAVAWGFLWAIP